MSQFGKSVGTAIMIAIFSGSLIVGSAGATDLKRLPCQIGDKNLSARSGVILVSDNCRAGCQLSYKSCMKDCGEGDLDCALDCSDSKSDCIDECN